MGTGEGAPTRVGSVRRALARAGGGRLALAKIVAVTALGVVLGGTPLLDGVERSTLDARFELRGERTPRADVVVVAIDDRTFSDLDQRWPFPRTLHAQAIRRIAKDGPRAIVYDVQFSEETDASCDPDDPNLSDRCVEAIEADNALLLALRSAGDVVLATTEVSAQGAPNLLGGDPEAIAFARARPGIARFVIDPGGVYRRARLKLDGLPTLPIAAAGVARGRPVGAAELPEDPFLIDYAGPPGTIPHVSFSRLLRRGGVAPGAFRDKIVVVGPVAPTLQDVHPTSFASSGAMSGAEIQANAVATVLDGFPLAGLPRWTALLASLLLAGFPVAVGSSSRRRLRPSYVPALVGLGLAVAAVLVAVAAFAAGVVVPLAAPLAALAAGTALAVVISATRDAVEREFTRRVFGRFLSDDVVDQVLERAAPDGTLRLGGERMEVTVMFSDIRGFTTFSERNRPEFVLELLNRYLETMSEAILDRGGTITGFMGDGIMAVFGAPVAYDDHADRAVEAAFDMLRRCAAFNAELAQEGIDVDFRMGVGLNTGQGMSGNVGSQRRLDYSVIGDVTNTAARLEGATKGTGKDLFVAEATFQRLRRDHDLAFHDTIEIRGREAGVAVYAPAPGGTSGEVPAS